MKTKIILKITILIVLVLNAAHLLTSCQADNIGEGNGLTANPINSNFTITPIAGESNRYAVENGATSNALALKWDKGDGSAEFLGKSKETFFFPDAGSYLIKHSAVGLGGKTYTTSKEVLVATSDPVSGNLVKGGRFSNATDHGKWTVLNTGGSSTTWSFSNGKATIRGTSGGWDSQAIYQTIQVVAGKKYKIDMRVSGSSCVNTWFEVYASPVTPVQNSDYSADGRRIGMTTWEGCLNNTFDGQLSQLGCVGSGNQVQFTQSGTIYLVIKSGGNNLGTSGISITNVEFRGV
jgi:hypothetical protein